MLDYRKPYVLATKGKGEKNWFGDGDDLPGIAIKAQYDYWDGNIKAGKHLFYYDIGSERGHILPGKIVKDMKNGVIFKWDDGDDMMELFRLTELTMEEFERRVRPHLQPEVSRMLNDLDDVYTWYRQLVGMA